MKFAALFLVATALLRADGGSVLLRQQSNGLLVTVFGTPQVGQNDLNVLVQNAADRSPILDAAVDLRIEHSLISATHARATNKLLYAASVNLFHPGKSRLEVTVAKNGSMGTVAADLDVVPATAPWVSYWGYFALVPAAILLFALNQWLKTQRLKRPSARP